MAEPFQKNGTWYARVKDVAGRWRNVALPEAKTKAAARVYAAELSLNKCRQRDGLAALPTDPSLTVGALLRWWLDTYVAGRTWASKEEHRYQKYFVGTELAALPVVALNVGRFELFLQHWTREGLASASVNKLRAMVRTAWNRARKAGLVTGMNPAADVELRKVPKRGPVFLEPHEVPKVLAELTTSAATIGTSTG